LKQLQIASGLAQAPATSGVFARFRSRRGGSASLELLGPRGTVARVAPAGTGLVAARAVEDQAPTWLITGIDDAGVARAAAALSASTLKYAFAVAATPSGAVRLPVENAR
jgi:hypothetical protein